MDPLVDGVRLVLVRELKAFQREIEMFPDDELVWRTTSGVSNSAATLALHVCGNLQHFVGAVLGATGYVRNRDLEFSRRSGPRAELARELGRAIEVVQAVLPGIPAESLSREYPEAVGGIRLPTGLFLLHLATHLAHHLGQAGYLRRVLTGENRGSGAISVKALAEAAGVS
jgi:uncharacterized damage-inducible protein DinB